MTEAALALKTICEHVFTYDAARDAMVCKCGLTISPICENCFFNHFGAKGKCRWGCDYPSAFQPFVRRDNVVCPICGRVESVYEFLDKMSAVYDYLCENCGHKW